MKLLIVASLVISFVCIAGAQQKTFDGKLIKKGEWKGETIEYLSGGITIKLKTVSDTTRLKQVLAKFGAVLNQNYVKTQWRLIEFPESLDVFIMIEELKKLPYIEVAKPNVMWRQQDEPNDAYYKGTSPATYASQWALKNTGQESGSNVLIL